MSSDKSRFLLLYGSQTGQAQGIAEEITDRAPGQGLNAELHCLSLTEKRFYLERETCAFYLERETCAVIIVSTTGDGEPPDTVLKFMRRLRKKTLPGDYMAHLHYTMLGLGDSNYTNFCKCGKTLDGRLQQLGATRFYPAGWADDATGSTIPVEAEVFKAIFTKTVQQQTSNCARHHTESGTELQPTPDSKQPMPSKRSRLLSFKVDPTAPVTPFTMEIATYLDQP
ncbi:hypothetical protein LSAT2_000049 [Lamellibrachia satsuma]|nr:hypothetical protein LSAT2_000049 [Lamellibrachia satsuma]